MHDRGSDSDVGMGAVAPQGFSGTRDCERSCRMPIAPSTDPGRFVALRASGPLVPSTDCGTRSRRTKRAASTPGACSHPPGGGPWSVPQKPQKSQKWSGMGFCGFCDFCGEVVGGRGQPLLGWGAEMRTNLSSHPDRAYPVRRDPVDGRSMEGCPSARRYCCSWPPTPRPRPMSSGCPTPRSALRAVTIGRP